MASLLEIKKTLQDKILKAKLNLKKELGEILKGTPLTENFDLFDSAYSFEKLKSFILQIAINGKLFSQNSKNESAKELLNKIEKEKEKLNSGDKSKKEKAIAPISIEEVPYNLPNGWEWCRLGGISKYIQRGKSPEYTEHSEIPVISQKCIQWSGFDIKKARFITKNSFEKYEKNRFLENRDLLWNSTGLGTVGRLCIYEESLNPFKIAVADSHVTIVRLFKELVVPEFALLWLSSKFIQENLKVSGSTKQKELALTTIKDQIFPLPPLVEQKEVVKKVGILMGYCNELEKLIRENQENSEGLMGAVLKESFENGKL
ncbi:MAG: restriction endonuclease subunit S [Candidatus Nanoarchaeia archaeon]|nr:restriction endonuclease subunit S [Candidatus Nanoarchaeia archaeon]